MSVVLYDISISLDGYITAPNDRPGEELGDDGQRLHEWVSDSATDLDRQILAETWDGAGAVVSGARTFDVCFDGWGGRPPADVPWFVLSYDRPDRIARGKSLFTFVLDGAANGSNVQKPPPATNRWSSWGAPTPADSACRPGSNAFGWWRRRRPPTSSSVFADRHQRDTGSGENNCTGDRTRL